MRLIHANMVSLARNGLIIDIGEASTPSQKSASRRPFFNAVWRRGNGQHVVSGFISETGNFVDHQGRAMFFDTRSPKAFDATRAHDMPYDVVDSEPVVPRGKALRQAIR